MTTEERARRLVGDMPWVTEHLTAKQLADLPRQIETCLRVAVAEERSACAAVAKGWRERDGINCSHRLDIAEAILARGKPEVIRDAECGVFVVEAVLPEVKPDVTVTG